MEPRIWSAITSVNSVRTILIPRMLPVLIAHHLQPHFSVVGSALDSISIRAESKEQLRCHGSSSRYSCGGISEILGLLSIAPGVRLNEILSTNKKKFKIGQLISNISNRFS